MKGLGLIAIIALVLLAARSGGSGGGTGGGVGPPSGGGNLCSSSDIRRMNAYISLAISRGYTYATLPFYLKIPFDYDYANCPNYNSW